MVYYIKVRAIALEQETRAEGLRNTIIPLWERLEISGEFREEFLAKHSGYKAWMIKEVLKCMQELHVQLTVVL